MCDGTVLPLVKKFVKLSLGTFTMQKTKLPTLAEILTLLLIGIPKSGC